MTTHTTLTQLMLSGLGATAVSPSPKFPENHRPHLKSTIAKSATPALVMAPAGALASTLTSARVAAPAGGPAGAPVRASSGRRPGALAGVPPATPSPGAAPDPLTEFKAHIADELRTADSNLLARRFGLAVQQYNGIFTEIQNWVAAGNPSDDELEQDLKLVFNGILDGQQGLGNYVPLEQAYMLIFGPATGLSAADQAFYGQKLATVYLDWGNSVFRNDQAADALTIYQNILTVDGTVPASRFFQLPGFQAAAAAVTKIIGNLDVLIQGTTTSTMLGVNPVLAGTVVEVHHNLVKIQNGLDFWGHFHNTVPIWTFEYLQSAAINFTQFAVNAERDFISFQQRSDEGSATRQQLAQLASQASAEVDAAAAQATAAAAEAQAYVQGADLAQERADDAETNVDEYGKSSALSAQFDAMRSQIAGGDGQSPDILNAIADRLMTGGKPGVSDDLSVDSDRYGVYSANNVAAGAQLASARASRRYELRSMQRTADQMKAAAAQAKQEVVAAQARVAAANAATAVARLHAEAAQQNLETFDQQTFTPDVWQQMADSMFRLYRRYLDMALKTALLMQQAYNFETDQSLSFIKKDYSTDEVIGLLGADALMADIQSFTYDLITSTTGKAQPVRQTISLAQRYAFKFEQQFRRTGMMEFETRIEDFDYLYPGTYAGRIERVGVEVVGLIPPNGVSGSLTNTGISGYRTPARVNNPDASGLKYRVQNRETLVLSDYAQRVDDGLIRTDPRINGIFEGAGLVSSWKLEIPPEVNDIDYGALLDVRLTFYYKARYDPDLHESVLAELRSRPEIQEKQRGIPLRWLYPDAFFHFQDTGVLSFSQAAQDFASNETRPVITHVGVVVATDGSISPQGLVVRLVTPGQTEASAVADAKGVIDSGTAGSPWASLTGGSALGDYVLTMTAGDNPALVVNGALNLSPIVNIALVLGYTFSPKTTDGIRSFSTIDFPGAASTLVWSANGSGQIVGGQLDAHGVFHSFAADAKALRTFDPPFSGNGPAVSFASGINIKGDVVGAVLENSVAQPHSQAYIKRGDSFTLFNHSDADPVKGTEFDGINDAGLRVGLFTDTAGMLQGFFQDDLTTTTLASLPGVPANKGTWLSDVNNHGQMVGGYFDATSDVQHGLMKNGAQFVTIDFPGADITWLNGINDSGQMAGAYVDNAAGVFRGFVTDGATFAIVNYPNLPKGFGTFVTGIDNSGRLVGYYGPEAGLEGSLAAAAPLHGFVAEPF